MGTEHLTGIAVCPASALLDSSALFRAAVPAPARAAEASDLVGDPGAPGTAPEAAEGHCVRRTPKGTAPAALRRSGTRKKQRYLGSRLFTSLYQKRELMCRAKKAESNTSLCKDQLVSLL